MLDISVLIATLGRVDLLSATLAALAELETEGISWELVLATNGAQAAGSLDLQRLIESMRGRVAMTVVHEPEADKCKAMNRAMDVARGRLLVFTDDDVRPVAGWLRQYANAVAAFPADGIFCGPIEPDFPPHTPAWLRTSSISIWAHGRFTVDAPLGPIARFPFAANLALPAKTIAGARWKTTLGRGHQPGDDLEFLRPILDRGVRIIYVPGARLLHHVAPNQLEEGWLRERAFRFGRAAARLGIDHPGLQVGGVPWHLWPRFLLRWALEPLAVWSDDAHFKIANGCALEHLRGDIQYHREQRRAGAGGRPVR